ncbi:MAG TPA: HAMP domain-containing sensor histidine kinase, partial [Kineosporiaceae bacterium]|nr:HAMP domain-containing sensor histidine kinase [Kineosporiaceae bacterium]
VRTAERLRPQFEDAGLELDVRPGPPLPVRADPQRIAQVLTNLMGNALNYTPQGGHVSVRSGTDATGPWVTVTDTGVGLDPTELGRVFERFYRVPRATAADSGQRDPGHPDSAHRATARSGSGIGLTIARGIARAHGGDVTADSAGRGRGATFTLRLPQAGSKAA